MKTNKLHVSILTAALLLPLATSAKAEDPTDFDQWREYYLEEPDPDQAHRRTDDDGDSWKNYVEYFFDTDPTKDTQKPPWREMSKTLVIDDDKVTFILKHMIIPHLDEASLALGVDVLLLDWSDPNPPKVKWVRVPKSAMSHERIDPEPHTPYPFAMGTYKYTVNLTQYMEAGDLRVTTQPEEGDKKIKFAQITLVVEDNYLLE